MKARALAATACVALLAGCQPRTPAPVPPRPAPPQAPAVERPEVYLQTGLAYEFFFRELTNLAADRVRLPATRVLIQQMRVDHQGLSAQFGYAARRLDRLNYPVLGPLFEQRLGQLRASGDPDGTYRQLMLITHRELAAKHQAFSRAGASPTLRTVATHAASVEREHLRQLGS